MSYKRLLLKISGEALASPDIFYEKKTDASVLYHGPTLHRLAKDCIALQQKGYEIGIVIGGGNIIRGAQLTQILPVRRPVADTMGMMATIINAMALQQVFEFLGIDCRVQTSIPMETVAEAYSRRRTLKHLEKGRIVIFAGGTGDPYFTTDTASVLRALEMECDVLIKATNVDGIYSTDPKKDPSAILYTELTFQEAIDKHLKVMDATAFTLLRENKIPLMVCSIEKTHDIDAMLYGHRPCTRIFS